MSKYEKHKHLDYYDRQKLEELYNSGERVADIAAYFCKCRQTIYNELRLGFYEHLNSDLTTCRRYSADKAQERHDYNATAKGAPLKIGNNHELAARLEYLIGVERRSPYDALCVVGMPFCVSTLYSYIEKGVFRGITNADLWVKSRMKPRGYREVAKRAPKGTSIDKRPEVINERREFGHWEMDCVEGKKGDMQALLVLTERLTRTELIFLLHGKTAANVVKALNRLRRVEGFERAFKSITVDNGSEFAWEGLMRGTGAKSVDFYYCHPYCSSERGSNECANKQVRKYFPKGQSMAHVRKGDCVYATMRINDMHRRLLDGRTAEQLFNQETQLDIRSFYNAA